MCIEPRPNEAQLWMDGGVVVVAFVDGRICTPLRNGVRNLCIKQRDRIVDYGRAHQIRAIFYVRMRGSLGQDFENCSGNLVGVQHY